MRILKTTSKYYVIALLFLIFLVFIKAEDLIKYTIEGGIFFLTKIFPSLFIFLIFTNIFMNLGGFSVFVKNPKKDFTYFQIFLLSLLCGYPLGSKFSTEAYKNGQISYIEYESLCSITSNPNPIFLYSTVGMGFYGDKNIGLLFLISSLISSMLMLLLFYRKTPSLNSNSNTNFKKVNIFENTFNSLLSIGFTIIIFYITMRILNESKIIDSLFNSLSNILNKDLNGIRYFLLGILEMSNGSYLISKSSIPIGLKLVMTCFLITFGGISILIQSFNFIGDIFKNKNLLIMRKIIQGLITSIVCIILLSIKK